MANLYGVANCPPIPALYNCIGSADVACSANAETNFIQTPAIIAPSYGYFYAYAWLAVHILTGATPPSSVVIAIRVNNGADLGSLGFDSTLFTGNQNLMLFGAVVTGAFQGPWQGTGSQIQLSATFSTQGGTVKFPSTNCLIGLFRAPDQ